MKDTKHKQYFLPEQVFDAYPKNASVETALGSKRQKEVQEISEIKSTNFVPGVSGWRLTNRGIELGNPTATIPDGSLTHLAVSDFDEASQDAIGTILVDSTDIDFTYTDATPAITAVVKATVLGSGSYAPTRSAEANLDSNITFSSVYYHRVRDMVVVFGRFTADPTLTATATSFEMTLPIASNIGAAEDVGGVAFCGTIAGMGAEIIGVAANDTAKVQWISSDITAKTFTFQFSYRII